MTMRRNLASGQLETFQKVFEYEQNLSRDWISLMASIAACDIGVPAQSSQRGSADNSISQSTMISVPLQIETINFEIIKICLTKK